MSDTFIYYNPRCSKSRQTLTILEQHNVKPEVIEYLKTAPSIASLTEVIKQLGISARQLLRKGEAQYKELNLADESLSEKQLIQAMCDHPKLIERPIFVHKGKAKLGRPPEAVLEII
jgi:arsenate reductase